MEVARFEPRPVSTKYQSCSVSGCESVSHKDLTISFHKFPIPGKNFVKMDNEKVDRFLAWQTLLKIDRVTPKTKVCSLHFLKNDYFFPEIKAQKRMLKKIAVPSCNLPGNNRNEGKKASKPRRSKKRVINENPENDGESEEEMVFVKCEVEDDVGMEEEHVQSDDETMNDIPEFDPHFLSIVIKTEEPSEEPSDEPFFKDAAVQAVSETPKKPSVKDEAVQVNTNTSSSQFPFEAFIKKTKKSEPPVKDAEAQVNTDCFVSTVLHCIKSDDDLLTSTGIQSFGVLNTIVQRMTEICGDKFEHRNMRMNTKERVMMTYMKFKHNLSYSFLSILFKHYTPTHCQRIFVETVKILSKCSKDGIPWPSINDIPKNLRKHFQDDGVVVSSDPKTKQQQASSSSEEKEQ